MPALVAVLTQVQNGEERVICYASQSLTDVERRYSRTEREALDIVWACERLHMYLYGTDFEILTDHKPLEFIYSRKSHPTARVHRWVLRLQPCRFTVRHMLGLENIAETGLSLKTELRVAYPLEILNMPQQLTKNCPMLENVFRRESGRHLMVRSELSVIGKLVLRGTRIIVPSSLRERVLNLAHEGHPGIVLMKRRLRTKVFMAKL